MCYSYNLFEYFTGKCMADHDGEMFKSGESPNRLHYKHFSFKWQLNECSCEINRSKHTDNEKYL